MKPRRVEIGRGRRAPRGPIVARDRVYAGLMDDVTVCLDRRTLRKVWEVGSDRLWLGQALGDALLTLGGPSRGGVRSAEDGRLLWSADAPIMSGVSVWRGRVLVDTHTGIEIRDAETGAVVETRVVPGAYEYRHLTDGDVDILQAGPTVKAFNLASGRLEWERPLVDEMRALVTERSEFPVVSMALGTRRGTLIAFCSGATFACSVSDGSIFWRAAAWSPYGRPVVDDGQVYALCMGRFVRIDGATGGIEYDVKYPELRDALREKTGTIYKRRLAVAHESGHVAVFDLANGKLVTLYNAKVPLWTTAEADGRLLVATGDGALLVFDESIWGL